MRGRQDPQVTLLTFIDLETRVTLHARRPPLPEGG